jgi:DNA invertase Pin-like site-specific DNA recombinase
MLTDRDEAIPARVLARVCRCGCRQAVESGRKFVNQAHYDRSKGLSSIDAERLLARFQQSASAKKLACEYGVAHTTVYRLIQKRLS